MKCKRYDFCTVLRRFSNDSLIVLCIISAPETNKSEGKKGLPLNERINNEPTKNRIFTTFPFKFYFKNSFVKRFMETANEPDEKEERKKWHIDFVQKTRE